MVRGFYFCCEFLHTAVQAWFTLKLAGSVWEPKREARTQYAVWVAIALAVAGLNTYNDSVISVLFSGVSMMACILILSWFSKFLYYCRYKDVFCLVFLLWMMLALADFFFQTLAYTILDFVDYKKDIFLSVTLPRALYQLLWVFFLMGVVKNACQWGRQKRREIRRCLEWAWLLVLPSLLCMVYFQRIYLQVFSETLMYRWWLFLLGSMLLGVILLAYLLVQRERESFRIQQLRVEMLENEYQILRQTHEEIEVLRHDFEKHIQAIRELVVEEGGGQGTLEYLETMGVMLRKGENRNLVNHDLLNLILNTKYRDAEILGISVQYELDDMSSLQLEPMEMVSLFFNILDNAIEANQALEEGVKRWISLSCIRKGQMMIISASNAKAGEELKFEGGIPRTTKKDKKSHGLGLRSIRQVVEQHDGHMQIDVEEDTFSLVVYLKGFK